MNFPFQIESERPCYLEVYQSISTSEIKRRVYHYQSYFHLDLISIRHLKLVHYNMKFHIVLRYRYNIIMMLEKYIILRCHFNLNNVIDLCHDVKPTRNRCRHDITCPQGEIYLEKKSSSSSRV